MSIRQTGVTDIVMPVSSEPVSGFKVRRVLPSRYGRMVGPFVLFDQMGPAVFDTGRGFDMGPHPHIGLAAVTYLIDGEIVHRDSLGKVQALRPGASNRQRPIGANAVSPKCQGRANLFLCRRI